MNQYVAFLRGINLGKRRIKMDALRGHFERMKFSDVRTFIASGNVLFESRIDDSAEIASLVERHLQRALGYSVDTFVRSRAEIGALMALPPFSESAMRDESNTVNVGFFKAPLTPDIHAKLARIKTEVDEFHVTDREYFWLCRIKMSDSVVWQLPEAKTLKLPTSTMRNLKTLRALTQLFPPSLPFTRVLPLRESSTKSPASTLKAKRTAARSKS